MTQLLHHGHKARQWDPRAPDHGQLADQMEHGAQRHAGRFASGVRTNDLLSLLRRHLVTILVLCALLAVATSLAM